MGSAANYPPRTNKGSKSMRTRIATLLLIIWTILFFPWVIFAPLAGMAFDAGSTLRAYMFVSFMWTYPISVAVAWFVVFIKKKPLAALLPCVNVLGVFSDFLWK